MSIHFFVPLSVVIAGICYSAWFKWCQGLNSGPCRLCPRIYPHLLLSFLWHYFSHRASLLSVSSVTVCLLHVSLCQHLYSGRTQSIYCEMEYSQSSLAGLELLGTMICWPQVLGVLGFQVCATGARLWPRFCLFVCTAGTMSPKLEIGRLLPKDQILWATFSHSTGE